MKIRINVLSAADSVKGQGVGSAYQEQVKLIQELEDFDVSVNSKKGNFDIYHIHTVNLGYKFRMNKKHLNIVYVHFVPAKNDGSLKLGKPANYIFNKYVESFYRNADELIVVNPAFIPDLEKLGVDTKNITYIPNYVDHIDFKKISKEEIRSIKENYNIPLDKFVVLGCGQIQTRKGFDDFVEVARKNPDLFFVWVGGFSFGRITDGYKKYKKLLQNLPQNMVNIPIIDREYMNGIFNCCDVLFMPSFIELFPMTILEVANIHKPILLRNVDLYKPILFSKYCKGNNVEEFSSELKKLHNDVTYYDECSNNSKFISEFYNKDAMLKTWDEYYKRVYQKWKDKKNSK